jgi:hypothetical protein
LLRGYPSITHVILRSLAEASSGSLSLMRS